MPRRPTSQRTNFGRFVCLGPGKASSDQLRAPLFLLGNDPRCSACPGRCSSLSTPRLRDRRLATGIARTWGRHLIPPQWLAVLPPPVASCQRQGKVTLKANFSRERRSHERLSPPAMELTARCGDWCADTFNRGSSAWSPGCRIPGIMSKSLHGPRRSSASADTHMVSH